MEVKLCRAETDEMSAEPDLLRTRGWIRPVRNLHQSSSSLVERIKDTSLCRGTKEKMQLMMVS